MKDHVDLGFMFGRGAEDTMIVKEPGQPTVEFTCLTHIERGDVTGLDARCILITERHVIYANHGYAYRYRGVVVHPENCTLHARQLG